VVAIVGARAQSQRAAGQLTERAQALAKLHQGSLPWFSDPAYVIVDHPHGIVVIDYGPTENTPDQVPYP
jgi:hypothetical protein